MALKAGILAVGSELLSGQVTNRNAAWLSNKLFSLGIDVVSHVTVDDVEGEIIAGLEALVGQASLIFVTGGLGPTSDDLTREAVAKWSGQSLKFDPASWDHITKIFARFSNTVPETNRQQCYFPEAAQVLSNQAGTANGFKVAAHGKELWVLPGPPREVEVVWADHIDKDLKNRLSPLDRAETRMWRTIGKGESHLAELLEPKIKGHDVQLAYRAHAPYVEVKVRYPAAAAAKQQALLAAIDQLLSPWIYERDSEDIPTLLVEKVLRFASIDLFDGATQGNVAELFMTHVRERVAKPALISAVTSLEGYDMPAAFVDQSLSINSSAELALAIAGFDESGNWALGIRVFEDKTILERPAVYKGEAMRQRNLRAIAALAAKTWYDILSGRLH